MHKISILNETAIGKSVASWEGPWASLFERALWAFSENQHLRMPVGHTTLESDCLSRIDCSFYLQPRRGRSWKPIMLKVIGTIFTLSRVIHQSVVHLKFHIPTFRFMHLEVVLQTMKKSAKVHNIKYSKIQINVLLLCNPGTKPALSSVKRRPLCSHLMSGKQCSGTFTIYLCCSISVWDINKLVLFMCQTDTALLWWLSN